MKKNIFVAAPLCAMFLSLGLASTSVLADDIGLPGSMPKSYSSECSSCHTAYVPALLPAKSWSAIMTSLDKHYGSDASIDPKSVAEISAWLQRNAASSRKFSIPPPDNRITRSDWFTRQHNEIRKDVWQRASIKSRANCSACHQQAARGDFDEDNVRIPK